MKTLEEKLEYEAKISEAHSQEQNTNFGEGYYEGMAQGFRMAIDIIKRRDRQ